jgi:hypothetical protein
LEDLMRLVNTLALAATALVLTGTAALAGDSGYRFSAMPVARCASTVASASQASPLVWVDGVAIATADPAAAEPDLEPAAVAYAQIQPVDMD